MSQPDNWPVPARTTRRVLIACWTALLAEGYDVGVLGAVLPAIRDDQAWALNPLQLGGLGAYALVGMLIGAMTIGSLSDAYGRKRMLIVSMIIFTSTQLGAALAPTPELFGLFRLFGGLGMGGIIPIAAALTIEFSPPKRRLRNYGIMFSAYSFGIVVAALAALILVETYGWRLVVGLGVVPIVLVPLVWMLLPESLEYLTGKGLIERAAVVARKFGVSPYIEAQWAPQKETEEKLGLREALVTMFSRRYLFATIGFWVGMFCALLLIYGLNTWLPSIMRAAGYDLGPAIAFLLVYSLASAIGGFVLGWAADSYGKKRIIIGFYAMGGAAIVLLSVSPNPVITYTLVALAGVGTISASLVQTGWIPAYYPSAMRATATGWALSFARIGAISGPIIGGLIGSLSLGDEWSFYIFGAVGAVAALITAIIPAERRLAASGVAAGERAPVPS